MNNLITKNYKYNGKTLLLCIIYLIINGLFIFKYIRRFNFVDSLIVFFIYILLILTFFIINQKLQKKDKLLKFFLIALFIISLALIIFIQIKINPLTLKVDRWSAINNFLSNLFKGKSPYSANTHLGGYGSPFPVWQIFHIPFYFLGDVGLCMIFCFVCLILCIKWYSKSDTVTFTFLSLMALSPAFWYEVSVRSDLMYNFFVVFIALLIIQKKNFNLQNNTISLGIVCGLFMSTRLSVFLPLFLYFFYEFWTINLKKKILFIVSGLVTFILSFLPFVLWDYKTLFLTDHNPFILQTRQGFGIDIIIIIALAICFSFKAKNNFYKIIIFISFSLFILVAINFLFRLSNENFADLLFNSGYDITYFNMSLPFIIAGISLINRAMDADL